MEMNDSCFFDTEVNPYIQFNFMLMLMLTASEFK